MIAAVRRLAERYAAEHDAFIDAEKPLWMSVEKAFATRAMLQAKRDFARDLVAELEMEAKRLGGGR